MGTTTCLRTAAYLLAAASGCRGEFLYTVQERTIAVSTAADGAVEVASANDFAPFVADLALRTTFATPDGGTGLNAAEAGIDCHLDPNRIRLIGRIFGAGGTGVFADGTVGVIDGHAELALRVDVTLSGAELVSVASRPRPNVNPEDKFKIKIRRTGGEGTVVFQIDETSPPTEVDTLISLPAGDYSVEYQSEITVLEGEASSDIGFLFASRSADINGDGLVDTNDLIKMLASFGRSGMNSWSEGTEADLDGNGDVDTADLSRLLGRFGEVNAR